MIQLLLRLTLILTGNFTNNGVLIIENNTVNFTGIIGQLINGAAEISFYDLLISNSAARVQAATNLNVGNNLALQAGGVFKPAPAVVINNTETAGTLQGSGTLEVTRHSGSF